MKYSVIDRQGTIFVRVGYKLLLSTSMLIFVLLYLGGYLSIAGFNVVTIILTVLVVLQYVNMPAFQLVLLFCSLFPFYMLANTYFGLNISDYSEYMGKGLIFKFLFIHCLFMLGVGLAAEGGRMYHISTNLPKFNSTLLKVGVSLALVLSCLFFRGENIFLAENPYMAYVNNLKVESGLPEYALLLLLFQGLVFSRVKAAEALSWFSICFYFYQLVVMGYRVQLLMAIILMFFLRFECQLKRYYIPFLFLGGFSLFSVLGYVKDGGLEQITFRKVFFDDSHGFVLAHHTGVAYSSLAVLGNISNGRMGALDRLYSSLGLILNSVIPSGVVNRVIPEANVSLYVKEFTHTAGGVYAPLVFFVSLGYLGPLMFGYIVSRLYIYSSGERAVKTVGLARQLCSVFSIMTIGTFPRWVSYDLGNFFLRLPIYAVITITIIYMMRGESDKV